MTDLVKLLDGELTDLERALLESAREDRPAEGARDRTLALLGLTGAAVAVSGTAKAHLAGSAGGGSSAMPAIGVAAAKMGTSITAWSIAKWMATGTLVGMVGLGAVTAFVRLSESQPPDRGSRAARLAVLEPRRVAEPDENVNFAGPDERAEVVGDGPDEKSLRRPDVGTPEARVVAPRAPVSSQSRSASRQSTAQRRGGMSVARQEGSSDRLEPQVPSVLEEVASLDEARLALGRGDSKAALILLNGHERRFGSGTLSPEVQVLRIRALLKAGRRAEAERRGDEFLARYSNSPHAAHVRALLGRR